MHNTLLLIHSSEFSCTSKVRQCELIGCVTAKSVTHLKMGDVKYYQ